MRLFSRSGLIQICAVSLLLLGFSASGCKPMCPIPNCNVRMVHLHGKAEYRGSRWYKKQNPHIGEKLPKATVDRVQPHNDKSRMRK